MNAVTDNPTVFPETDEVVSAGNFHGQPLALIMDFLAIAMAEMGSISERRVYNLDIDKSCACASWSTPCLGEEGDGGKESKTAQPTTGSHK